MLHVDSSRTNITSSSSSNYHTWVDNHGLAHLVARESVVIPLFHSVLVDVTASASNDGTFVVLPENCRVKDACSPLSVYFAGWKCTSSCWLIECLVTDLPIAEFELPTSASLALFLLLPPIQLTRSLQYLQRLCREHSHYRHFTDQGLSVKQNARG